MSVLNIFNSKLTITKCDYFLCACEYHEMLLDADQRIDNN